MKSAKPKKKMKPTLEKENNVQPSSRRKWLIFVFLLLILILFTSRGFWIWVCFLVPFAISFIFAVFMWVGLLKPGPKLRAWISMFCLAGIIGLPSVFAWASFTYLHRFNTIQDVDAQLTEYLQTHGNVPETLIEANIDASGISYQPSADKTTYTLSFSIPGWINYSTADKYTGTDDSWDWD